MKAVEAIASTYDTDLQNRDIRLRIYKHYDIPVATESASTERFRHPSYEFTHMFS